MRTHLLTELNKNISTIDRNLTQLMFISEQFLLDNRSQFDSKPDEFSHIVYSDNPYRNEFNYRLCKISEEVNNLRFFTFASGFVLAYSIYETYTKDLFKLIQRICEPNRERKNKESLIDYMFVAYLNKSVQEYFTLEEIDTINYIRLRRNVLVHEEGRLSVDLGKIIKKGATLNHFWQSLGLHSLNFTSTSIDKFSAGEIIDLLRLIRNLATKIDKNV